MQNCRAHRVESFNRAIVFQLNCLWGVEKIEVLSYGRLGPLAGRRRLAPDAKIRSVCCLLFTDCNYNKLDGYSAGISKI